MTKTTPYYSPGQNIDCDNDFTIAKERDLFTRFYANGDGSTEARDELIKQYLKLVLQLSVRHARGRITSEDAISAGNLALIEALESRRFDIKRGIRFSTFLGHYIRGRVAREAREFPRIDQATPYPDDEDESGKHDLYRERPDDSAEHAFDLVEWREIIKPLLGLLNESELYFVDAHYFKGLSLWEAARNMPSELGGPVSREWASKLHGSAMKKFRKALKNSESPFK
jgi:RNA polymerase sigma factor (sigma-70 family)